MNDTNMVGSRRRFLKTGVAAMALAACPSIARSQGKDRPNIVFLLADDQRADAIHALGNPIIQTPNIDGLVESGVTFNNNFVTTSICMSSRASFFTGLYTHCHGINDFRTPLASEKFEQIYPIQLKNAGYRTGFIGKWGLGGTLPADRFDYFKGFSGQGKYYHERDGKIVHLTSIMGEQAEQFLDGCSSDQPFCLSVSFKAPHVQDEDPRQFLYDMNLEGMYSDVEIPVPEKAADEYFENLPPFVQDSESRIRWKKRFATPEMFQRSVKGYYRLVSGIDRVVGNVRRKLKEKGLDQNTIIVYTSDNGFYLGEYGLAGKWFMHEDSIRTPLIVFDPRLPKSRWGSSRDEITLNIDAAPTLLAMAGIRPAPHIQGRSLLPLIEGTKPAWRNEFFYEHQFDHATIPKCEGIRDQRWKYVNYNELNVEQLYDLQNDPNERHNLALSQAHQKQFDQMRIRHLRWKQALNDWTPGKKPWKDPA